MNRYEVRICSSQIRGIKLPRRDWTRGSPAERRPWFRRPLRYASAGNAGHPCEQLCWLYESESWETIINRRNTSSSQRTCNLSPRCSVPPCSLGFLCCAEPSLAAFIHSNSRVRFLVLHVINPPTSAGDIPLNRAFGRWRTCGRGGP